MGFCFELAYCTKHMVGGVSFSNWALGIQQKSVSIANGRQAHGNGLDAAAGRARPKSGDGECSFCPNLLSRFMLVQHKIHVVPLWDTTRA